MRLIAIWTLLPAMTIEPEFDCAVSSQLIQDTNLLVLSFQWIGSMGQVGPSSIFPSFPWPIELAKYFEVLVSYFGDSEIPFVGWKLLSWDVTKSLPFFQLLVLNFVSNTENLLLVKVAKNCGTKKCCIFLTRSRVSDHSVSCWYNYCSGGLEYLWLK